MRKVVAVIVVFFVSASPAIGKPLNTKITGGPAGAVPGSTVTFAFKATVRHAKFQCDLDRAGWSACTSPRAYADLSNGDHKFRVRARKRRATDRTPASREFTIHAASQTPTPPPTTDPTTTDPPPSTDPPITTDPPDDDDPDGPDPGFGTIAGPCDLVASELGVPTPSLFSNRLDFDTDPFDSADRSLLTVGGRTIYDAANGGGTSLLSEVFAYEVLARCERASLVKTETEIIYTGPGGKITDMSVAIGGSKVGVGVTRAWRPLGMTQQDADTLLAQKLDDIQESSQRVSTEDAWVKQILVVMAYSDAEAELMRNAWNSLDDATKADTIVYVVTTDGSDSNLYCTSGC
jgi:hypothetical protein